MTNTTPQIDIRYRIRHIRHISLRRLSTTEIPTLFFTLHCMPHSNNIIYRSENHTQSRNPTWKKIAHTELRDNIYCSDSRFILRIWTSAASEHTSKETLVIEWNVDMNELVGIETHRIGVLTSPNLVLFGLRNTNKSNLLFTDRALVEGLRSISHETDIQYSHDFPTTTPLRTYSLPTLHTLTLLIGAVYTEERRKTALRNTIQTRLKRQYESNEKIDKLKLCIEQLKKRRKDCVLLVEKKRMKFQDICNNVQSHQSLLQQNTEELKSNQLTLEDRKDRHSIRKSNLIHQLNTITYRRLYLIKNLGYIYDIIIPPDIGKLEPSQEIFLPTILGIPLPRQSTINQTFIPDIGINTSLGFVVHLISLLELILRLPLRFPVLFNGSQSLILNESTYSGDEFREVPLYFKRKGDLSINKLEHALFLLNHDLIQVRQHLGLTTYDFKATLKNIKSLFTESEICLKRLSENRFSPNESLFRQENQDSIDLIFNEVTGVINGFQDVPPTELMTVNQS